MGKYVPYYEKLQDVRWQRKRLEILSRAGWMCDSCQAGGEEGGATMHVHHSFYRKGVEPWDYPNGSYQVLCAECHELAEGIKQQFEEYVFTLPPNYQDEIIRAILKMTEAEGHAFSGADKLLSLVDAYAKTKKTGEG